MDFVCKCCGGPRSKYSTKWCRSCYRLESRPKNFNRAPFEPGVTTETLAHFYRDAAVLRRHGHTDEANQIFTDMDLADELAKKYGFALHSDAVGQSPRG